MDRGRLLIPRVAIGDVSGEDALADVGVESLIRAHRLRERRQAHQQQDARERQAQPRRHGWQSRIGRWRTEVCTRGSAWIIVLGSPILGFASDRRAVDRRAHLQRAGPAGRSRRGHLSRVSSRTIRRRAGDRGRQLARRHGCPRRRARAAIPHPGHSPRRASSVWGPRWSRGSSGQLAPIVGVIDADLSHPPRLLPRMLAVMQHATADMVIGSRYIPGRRNEELGRRAAAHVPPRVRDGARSHPREGRDVRFLPDSQGPRARRADLGRWFQNLPRAPGARPAARSSRFRTCSSAGPLVRAR